MTRDLHWLPPFAMLPYSDETMEEDRVELEGEEEEVLAAGPCNVSWRPVGRYSNMQPNYT